MQRYLEKFREVQRGMSLRSVLTVEWVAAVQDMLRALAQGENIRLEGGLTRGFGAAGVSIGMKRARRARRGGGGGATGPCHFGEVITFSDASASSAGGSSDDKTGIRGGIIEAGDDQWHEPHHELALTPDREKLVWIAFNILANTSTGGTATLSGIKNGDRAGLTWNEGDVSDDYPDKITPPAFPTGGVTPGAGRIILPIGKLTVTGGVATLVAAGCGHFTVTHCPGTLSYERRAT